MSMTERMSTRMTLCNVRANDSSVSDYLTVGGLSVFIVLSLSHYLFVVD